MTDTNNEWYFAYGSNLDRDTFCGRRRIQPLAAKVARLSGYRLHFNLPVGSANRGVANILPDEQSVVWGVAYLISRSDGQRLDRSEGVHRGFYQRKLMHLKVRDAADEQSSLAAFSYTSGRHRSGRLPSARYLGLLVNGARFHDLPDEWVRWLLTWPLATDERKGGQQSLF